MSDKDLTMEEEYPQDLEKKKHQNFRKCWEKESIGGSTRDIKPLNFQEISEYICIPWVTYLMKENIKIVVNNVMLADLFKDL